MLVTVNACHGILERSSREMMERRLRFVLSRFGTRITRLELRVASDPQDSGAVEPGDGELVAGKHPVVQCRLVVRVRGAAEVVVEDQDRDLERCVTRIATRAGRAVTRLIAGHPSHVAPLPR